MPADDPRDNRRARDPLHGPRTPVEASEVSGEFETRTPVETPRVLVRLAELETWREETDGWRLRLTGVADGNGRLGTLTRTVEQLRKDVGDEDECRRVRDAAATVRGVKRWLLASVGAALVAVGGSAWGLVKSRDENIAAAARAAERLERLREDIEHNREDIRLVFERLPFLGLAPSTPNRE